MLLFHYVGIISFSVLDLIVVGNGGWGGCKREGIVLCMFWKVCMFCFDY